MLKVKKISPKKLKLKLKAKLDKASKTTPLIVAAIGLNNPIIRPATKYTEYAELYNSNVWVYSCIRAIADAGMGLPLRVFYKALNDEEVEKAIKLKKRVITKDPTDKVQWIEVDDEDRTVMLLQNPSPVATWVDLVEATMIYLEIDGNAFWEVSRVGAIPTELYPMRPDRVSIIPRKDGKGVKGYLFKLNNRAKGATLPAEDVLHFKYFNPLDDWRGMGSVQPATDAIIKYQYIDRYNKNFFKNDATPAGYLWTERPLEEEDIKRVSTQWNQGHRGVGHAHKTAVMPFGLKYERLGSEPKGDWFTELVKSSREEMLSSFSVPPVHVGLMEHAKYDNYKLQEFAFYRGTIRPKTQKISAVLTRFLNDEFGEIDKKTYWVEFDFEEFLGEDIKQKIDRYYRLFSMAAITPNTIIEEFNLGKPYEDGDTYYIAPGYLPVDGESRRELAMMGDEYNEAKRQFDNAVAEAHPATNENAQDGGQEEVAEETDE